MKGSKTQNSAEGTFTNTIYQVSESQEIGTQVATTNFLLLGIISNLKR